MALSKIQAESMNLADTYAFTGTVTGTSALVKISTTTISSQNTDITLPTGYRVYKLIGSNLVVGLPSQSYDLYTTTNNFSTTDTDFEGSVSYQRVELGNTGNETADGYVRLANNMSSDATDNLSFELTLTDLTVTRTQGYNVFGFSVYGHNNDQESYRYIIGARSQTSSVVNGLRINCSTGTGVGGTVSLYGVEM